MAPYPPREQMHVPTRKKKERKLGGKYRYGTNTKRSGRKAGDEQSQLVSELHEVGEVLWWC